MKDFFKENTIKITKALISIFALAAMVFHLENWYGVKFDNFSLILLAIAVIPWLFDFIDSFKLGADGVEIVTKKLEEKANELKAEIQEKTERLSNETTAKINEVKESNAVTQSISAFGTGGKAAKEKRLHDIKNESDPQKGLWGGSPVDNIKHRKLTANIQKTVNNSDFLRRVILRVESTDKTAFPLTNVVTFYLHPTFANDVIDVKPIDSVAEISLVAYGAFTVGAETDDGKTRLELDIAELGAGSGDPFFDR